MGRSPDMKHYLNQYLAGKHPYYDAAEKMLRNEGTAAGNYHSSASSFSAVHTLTASGSYATALLCTGDTALQKRGWEIFDRICLLQDAGPQSPTYGVWPYCLEEALDKMLNPDWNMADFNAKGLLALKFEFEDVIPADVMERCMSAVRRACGSIMARGVGPDYTNISLMDAYVATAAGEALNEQAFFEYGKSHLRSAVEYLERNGGFTEYNSPTYSVLALEDIGRMRKHFKDLECLDWAEKLNYAQWECLAAHYHPPTRQLAPPHSRCYSNFLSAQARSLLQMGTGFRYHLVSPADFVLDPAWLLADIGCPESLGAGFASCEKSAEIRHRYYSGYDLIEDGGLRVLLDKGVSKMQANTFMTPDFVLGSFEREDLWNQRRPLMAYYLSGGVAACLRPRFLKDGADSCMGLIQTIQHKNTALCGFSFAKEHGDAHFILSTLENGCFTAKRLALRFEVEGAPPPRMDCGGNTVKLVADAVTLKLELLHSVIDMGDGKQPPWLEMGETAAGRWIELVLYAGEKREFRMENLRVGVVFSLEIYRHDEAPAPIKAALDKEDAMVACRYAGESMAVRYAPQGYSPADLSGYTRQVRKGGYVYTAKGAKATGQTAKNSRCR